MAAKDVAVALVERFLRSGNFVLAGGQGRGAHPARQARPAAAEAPELPEYDDYGFSGLAVQSVGVEEGDGLDNPRVHVYVTKGSRFPPRAIESEGETVPVVINRIGPVVVRPEASSSVTHAGGMYLRAGRVACGSSCAPSAEQYAGTLGALVRRQEHHGSDGALGDPLFLLSNNHVLSAGNHIPVGQPILSPANIDARPGTRAPGEVGQHAEICELRSGDPELVPAGRDDIAIATAIADVVSSWQGDDLEGYDTPSSTISVQSEMRVKKFGRTTGLTTGVVESRQALFALPYKCRLFSAVVWFEDTWTVLSDGHDPFALSGDSGSLVVTEDGQHAVGVVFAAGGGSYRGGGYGIIIPIEHVLSMFGGLQLVSGHGV